MLSNTVRTPPKHAVTAQSETTALLLPF